MKAKELDRIFDEGKDDVLHRFDLSRPRHPGAPHKRVNVDFPPWMVRALDLEAGRVGVTRQSVIKMWIAERLGAARARPEAAPKKRPRKAA